MIADLIAGFGSFKFIPMPIVIWTNNANPKLALHDTYIEYRNGLATNKLLYDDIDKIDVYLLKNSTNNIVISKKTGLTTFIGNFRTRTQLMEFVRAFKAKGCTLTSKAENLLEVHPD